MNPQRKRIDVDVIKDVLLEAGAAQPNSEFLKSLLFQYEERGHLSRKQLEGLLSKSQKIQTISQGKLATLEAIIGKMHVRDKTPVSAPQPMFVKDEKAGALIESILQVFPEHKRVLFLQAKYDNNETITSAEVSELEKFQKLAVKKST
jgi:hypothetical protein